MKDNVVSLLEERGVKPTSNRIIVLRALLEADGPRTLMELEHQIDTLDKSSVFRVLGLLLKHGVVHVVEDGRGCTRYELCDGDHSEGHSDMHVHFYCERCDRVECFPFISVPQVALPDGYEVRNVNYMLKGLCPDCRRKK